MISIENLLKTGLLLLFSTAFFFGFCVCREAKGKQMAFLFEMIIFFSHLSVHSDI